MMEKFVFRFGIERRHPFYDRRLVEFVLSLPEEQRSLGEWPIKAVLREAMRGILPEFIRARRDKTRFLCIVDKQLKHGHAEKIVALMQSSVLGEIGAIQPDRFLKFFSSFIQGYEPSRAAWNIGMVVWLELWCRSFLNSSGNGELYGN
jgi:asparagine synthase (glutamine-hydrolysing)